MTWRASHGARARERRASETVHRVQEVATAHVTCRQPRATRTGARKRSAWRKAPREARDLERAAVTALRARRADSSAASMALRGTAGAARMRLSSRNWPGTSVRPFLRMQWRRDCDEGLAQGREWLHIFTVGTPGPKSEPARASAKPFMPEEYRPAEAEQLDDESPCLAPRV